MKHVIILGGGFGGLTAAGMLCKEKDIQVTLIEKRPKYYMGLTKLWVMIGKGSPDTYQYLYSILERKNIRVVQEEITAIDPHKNIVTTKKQSIAYDYLIVALGADVAPEVIPGVKEHGINLYDMHGVVTLHERLNDFKGGRIALLVCRPPYKCPAAPY